MSPCFMMVFLARRQGWFKLPLPPSGFACRAGSFTSHLREVTNSSHLVKVDTDFFGLAIQVGPESPSYITSLFYATQVIRLTFAIYLWYNVSGRKKYGINVLFVCGFYLSICGIYIAPFKVTTQKRSQPRLGQKGKASAAHDFGLLRAYTARFKLQFTIVL